MSQTKSGAIRLRNSSVAAKCSSEARTVATFSSDTRPTIPQGGSPRLAARERAVMSRPKRIERLIENGASALRIERLGIVGHRRDLVDNRWGLLDNRWGLLDNRWGLLDNR